MRLLPAPPHSKASNFQDQQPVTVQEPSIIGTPVEVVPVEGAPVDGATVQMVPDQGSVVPPATIGTSAETTSVDTGQVIGNGQVIVNPQVNQHPVVSDQVVGEQVIGDPGQSSVPAEASSQQTRIEPTPVETSDSTLDSQPKTFEAVSYTHLTLPTIYSV